MKHMLLFALGALAGGFVGVLTMCLFTVSSQASHWDELDEQTSGDLGAAPGAPDEQNTKK
jgi:hypothetical protein